MTSAFLTELRADLSNAEHELLVSCNIHSADDLYSFAMTFPALANSGIDLAKLSNFGAQLGSGSVIKVGRSIQAAGSPPQFPFGVSDSAGGSGGKGSTVPPPSSPGNPLKNLRRLDHRLKDWPVRDQGERGTCVAHALAALREHATGGGSLSPQFLFWATKHHGGDPFPDEDGSLLRYGGTALAKIGTCHEQDWPYDGTEQIGNVTHGTPPDPVQKRAQNFKKPSVLLPTARRGNAALLYDELKNRGAPVAISVPVFAGQGSASFTNWNTASGVVHGTVLDPPSSAVVVAAHAVCVTGFIPDPNELVGGFFVFRNSWGSSKWSHSPKGASSPPEPGYGRISATYIDRFAWELCRLA